MIDARHHPNIYVLQTHNLRYIKFKIINSTTENMNGRGVFKSHKKPNTNEAKKSTKNKKTSESESLSKFPNLLHSFCFVPFHIKQNAHRPQQTTKQNLTERTAHSKARKEKNTDLKKNQECMLLPA